MQMRRVYWQNLIGQINFTGFFKSYIYFHRFLILMSSLWYNKYNETSTCAHSFQFQAYCENDIFKNEKVLNLRLMHENCEKKYFKKTYKNTKKFINNDCFALLFNRWSNNLLLIIVYNLVRLSPRASITRWSPSSSRGLKIQRSWNAL